MAVTNRVWDTHLTGTVTWQTGQPDPQGIEYPGPGTFSQTSDFGIERGARERNPSNAQLHNLLHDPLALWQLNGDLTDSSATGEDLVEATGSIAYGEGIIPGTQAAYFDRGTQLRTTTVPSPAALRTTGDITVECLVYLISIENDTFGDQVVWCAGIDNGATDADNFLYALRISQNNTGINFPDLFWEGPASTFSEVYVTDFVMEPGRWHHFACTRINGGAGATTGRIYLNGIKIGEDTTLDEATGGASAFVKLGQTDTGAAAGFLGYMQSVKIIGRALTDAEILAEARLTLPPEVRP